MPALDTLLKTMLEQGGSDLHLTIGLPPKARISGALAPIGAEAITATHMEELLGEICPPRRWQEFLKRKDLDLAHEIPGLARFRANFLYNHWGQAAVFRQIPSKILSFDELKLPEVLKRLCHLQEGLVLVTGPTGSGKSTTLAAMIDYINRNLSRHIITIEDPIEFVHQNNKSIIVHREVGEHTASFADALKGAMRHDPDIVLLGEMRELETIKLALGCASMGMLVFGTLHTNNAPKTVDRIINAFPAEEQNQVRTMLAGCLAGVVSQLLCKRIPKGRVAVHEILLPHEALPNTIRTGQISNIRQLIESGSADGMHTMDQALMAFVKQGVIDPHEAYMKAANKATFAHLLPPDDPALANPEPTATPTPSKPKPDILCFGRSGPLALASGFPLFSFSYLKIRRDGLSNSGACQNNRQPKHTCRQHLAAVRTALDRTRQTTDIIRKNIHARLDRLYDLGDILIVRGSECCGLFRLGLDLITQLARGLAYPLSVLIYRCDQRLDYGILAHNFISRLTIAVRHGGTKPRS